jgi:hypothetical protein
MKVLMVGCGAVGQVFGLALQKAGAELGCYDRPAAAERLKQALEHGGMPLFQISNARGRPPRPDRLENYQVLADVVECQRFKPDQIWLALPSTVYYTAWLQEFLGHVPSERVVCFAPEGRRKEFFPQVAADRLVFGGITFMAWQGDLEGGGGRPEGVNFWRPPLLGIPLTGTEEACRAVERLLKKAGFRAALGKPDSPMQSCVTAVMEAFMAGLELAGWSLGSFRKSSWLNRAAGGAREAVLSQLSRTGMFPRALLGILLSPPGFRLATLLLPRLVPFDLEKYLKFHYLKTRDQTLNLLEVFASDGEKRALPVKNIRRLLEGLLNPE